MCPQELRDALSALEASQVSLSEHRERESMFQQQLASLKEAFKDMTAEREVCAGGERAIILDGRACESQ